MGIWSHGDKKQQAGVAGSSAHSQKGPLTCIQKILAASRTAMTKGGFNPQLPLFLVHVFVHQDYQQTLVTTYGVLQLKLPTSQET